DSETSETSGGGGEGSGGGSTLAFEADPGGQLAFTTNSATTKAGNVTIEFTNPQALPHDVKIEDSSGTEVGGTDTITEGSNSATVTLKAGSYTFYCSVPGHREAGMEGTLTVK
ncbi:MAG TPA: plastocyanin/azurin family copper-binding protein, partial [Solirubrobacterales bacterium]|nr:plastocyanin/azurin family copper-binding protein [Solirubrobacterales bacterium]